MRRAFSSLWILGIGTLIVFPALAWVVCYYSDQNFADIFRFNLDTIWTLPTFLSAGIFFGLGVIWLTELKYFEDALSKYRDILKGFKITRWQAFFLSLCAGVGEEVFFRGALQPLMGVWVTAFVFVAIHGYFSITNWKVNIFSVCLTLFIAVLGWAATEYSIYHAMAGHFSYDLVLLMYHRYHRVKE